MRWTYAERLSRACLLILACGLTGIVPDRAWTQAGGSGRQDVVRTQIKPDRPWKEYETRTVESLPGFEPGAVDTHLNKYGSRTDAVYTRTGYFYVEKIGNRWWIIDPEGCPYINKAVVSISVDKSEVSRAAALTKYGGEKGWADSTAAMLRTNGFNGTGAWTDTAIVKGASQRLPYTLIWNFMSSYGGRRGGTRQEPGHTGYPEDCIFVFDPAFAAFCDERAARIDEWKDDPYLLGHFTDNELPFPADALDRFLRLRADEAGAQKASSWLRQRRGTESLSAPITDEERSAFLELVAETYFRITSEAVRKHDPHHMILGSRFHAGTLNQAPVFRAAGRYADVISVNYYNAWTPERPRMEQWVAWSGRPILITEWYVKGADAGLPNKSGAGWIVPTQADRGKFYQNFALALLDFSGCVGWQWFKYIDNDPNAKNVDPSNSDSNKGIVSVAIEPYAPLLDRMRQLNVRAYRLIDYFDGKVRQ